MIKITIWNHDGTKREEIHGSLQVSQHGIFAQNLFGIDNKTFQHQEFLYMEISDVPETDPRLHKYKMNLLTKMKPKSG
jgi:hypothetical protein